MKKYKRLENVLRRKEIILQLQRDGLDGLLLQVSAEAYNSYYLGAGKAPV